MPLVSDYASRTPAETAFAEMLAAYDVTLPDVASFFDPTACPEQFLPYLAQSYYADTYSRTLGTEYNRRAVATASRINQIRGTWGAAQQVARNAGILAYVEYRRGPGLAVWLRQAARGAGRIGAVQYGAVWPARGMLPGGNLFRALEIPPTGNAVIVHAQDDIDGADWPDDGYAFSIGSLLSGGSPYPIPLSRMAVYGRIVITGKTLAIDLQPHDIAIVRTSAGLGRIVAASIRAGSLPSGTAPGWQARRDAWQYSHPLRNTGVNISVAPLRGVAATDYTQAMAEILDRILPYRVTVNDITLLNPLPVGVGIAPAPASQHFVYQGYGV